jgi:hypothetical protein
MQWHQIIGWDNNGKKVMGRHSEQCRDRGAVGQLWREYPEYNVKTKQQDIVMEPVGDHATA